MRGKIGKANGRNSGVTIIRREEVADAPHHGGAWKVAYADFVTAMMAFFLLMWLHIAAYIPSKTQSLRATVLLTAHVPARRPHRHSLPRHTNPQPAPPHHTNRPADHRPTVPPMLPPSIETTCRLKLPGQGDWDWPYRPSPPPSPQLSRPCSPDDHDHLPPGLSGTGWDWSETITPPSQDRLPDRLPDCPADAMSHGHDHRRLNLGGAGRRPSSADPPHTDHPPTIPTTVATNCLDMPCPTVAETTCRLGAVGSGSDWSETVPTQLSHRCSQND